MKLCHSEEDYDEIAYDKSHIVVDDENDNKDEIPFDPYVFALKVLKNEAAEIKQRKHGTMMPITKSMIMMMLRRSK